MPPCCPHGPQKAGFRATGPAVPHAARGRSAGWGSTHGWDPRAHRQLPARTITLWVGARAVHRLLARGPQHRRPGFGSWRRRPLIVWVRPTLCGRPFSPPQDNGISTGPATFPFCSLRAPPVPTLSPVSAHLLDARSHGLDAGSMNEAQTCKETRGRCSCGQANPEQP